MPPQTRSGGRAPAAPPDRVYKSSKPAKQAKFPHRKTEVRTYSARKPIARPSSHKQKTLTQMYETTRSSPIQLSLSDDEDEAPKRKRRRKTTGDDPTPGSSFHTQTLTQMSRKSSGNAGEEDDDIWQFQPSDEEPDKPVLPSASDKENRTAKTKPLRRTPSVLPQTPTNKRIVFEIQSSQGSPLTPMLARYSPAPKRSPLKDKSTNTMSPIRLPSAKRPRTLIVQDSFATAGSQSPSLHSSPNRPVLSAKNVRFITPRPAASLVPVEEEEDDDVGGREVSPSPQRPRRSPLRDITDSREIADSEDESDALDILDEEAEEYGAVGEETQAQMDQVLASSEQQASKQLSPASEGDSDKENVTPAASEEEEEEATVILSHPFVPPKQTGVDLGSDPELSRRETVEFVSSSLEPVQTSGSTVPNEQQSTEESITPTPTQTQTTPPADKGKAAALETPKTPHTQGFESQRLPLEVIRAMALQTDRSDIFISIHPEHAERIVAGTKNHEFRAYRIPNTVSRMWLYVTRPASELRYMACIGEAREPGEIDEDGLGNAEFNRGQKKSRFAYRLHEVYELNDPVPLAEMQRNDWLHGPPQKYAWVKPAVIGHLMANLRCSVFGDDEGENEDDAETESESEAEPEVGRASQKSAGPTVSQELADQIRSDIEQHSAHPSSDLLVPSSQTPTRGQRAFGTELFPKPALPPTPFSRPPNPTPRRAAVRPSQATTASLASSPSQSRLAQSLPQSVPRLPDDSSLPIFVDEEDEDDSPIRLPPATFQMDSSQLLSKSQMLPESLLLDDDGVHGDIVYDSEQEGGL
ncbi:hypothetical protein CMUS01_02552 [Colletotrichum musicola]|uniref:Uncharacterized protein n=1 Tax=Colletotrichum musicola TaxID=2175873 RepID=A0A8H6NUW0_9PEZI|nr:hypothetical protein CMUS01_02552 [Colletotrichum musicola]